MSVNTKKVTKNAYRIAKSRGKTALRVRVPGGHIETRHFALIQEIAEKYGDGTAHITTRQGFELPGIDFDTLMLTDQGSGLTLQNQYQRWLNV